MAFRNKLSGINTEEELFEYFSETAGYIGPGQYYCAGIYASDTAILYKKLKEAWRNDISDDALKVLIKE